MARSIVPSGAALALLFGISIAQAAPSYNFQTLNNNNDVTFNQLLGINNSGLIAGYSGSGNPGFPNKGYTLAPPYGQGNYTNENFPGSVQTQVTGLNNTGTTVGFWSNSNNGPPNDANFGFTDVGGSFTNVINPSTVSAPGVPSFNQLLGVNDGNTAVGFYTDPAANNHGYTYNIGTKTFSNINDPNAVSTTTAAINNTGLIAGFDTSISSGLTQGFIDKNGIFTEVIAPGASMTQLFGVNNNGLAVGDAVVNGVMNGILYDIGNGTFTMLNDPLGIGTTTLNGVNDFNQVVGFSVDGAGNTDGLLDTPVPEPGSLALLGTGLALLLGVGAARRRS